MNKGLPVLLGLLWLLPCAAYPATLGGPWTAIHGDDPAYAQPGLVETNWSPYTPPAPLDLGRSAPGIAWLRTSFVPPSDPSGEPLAVKLGKIDSASEVYLNGVLIGKTGGIEPPFADDYDRIQIYELPAGVLVPGTNVLAVRTRETFRYDGGGIYEGVPEIGSLTRILRDFYITQAVYLAFIVLTFLTGIYYFFTFVRLPQNRGPLFFALFFVLIAFYSFLRTQWKILWGCDFEIFKRIEHSVLSLIVPAGLFFFYDLFLGDTKSVWKTVYLRVAQVLTVVTVVTAFLPAFIRDTSTSYDIVRLIVYPAIFAAASEMTALSVSRVVKKKKDSYIVLAGEIVFILTVFSDIFTTLNLIHLPVLLPYGAIVFLAALFVSQTRQFAALYGETEQVNAKLSQAQIYKDEFITNMSAETHAPLVAITDGLALAEKKGYDKLDDVNRLILDNSAHILSLTDRILLAADLDGDRLHLRPARLPLPELVASVVEGSKKLARSAGVTVETDIPAGTAVFADNYSAAAALEMLVSNAIVYNVKGGKVSIRAVPAYASVTVSVADTGIGIDPSLHKQIFEKFFRIDCPETAGTPGTGLGLYLAAGLAAAMNGTVEVASEPGQGSTFTLVLPKG